MTKRSYQVNMMNDGGVLDSHSFDADDENDLQDAGAAAGEIIIQMIRDAGFLRPGDKFNFIELET